MVRKFTIAVDALLRLEAALLDGYRQMADDADGEAEAAAWVEALAVDVANESD